MNKAGRIVCKTLLDSCKPENKDRLIRYFPPLEKELIQAIPPLFGNPLEEEIPLQEVLEGIHESWYAPFLRTLPENDIRLFLSALSEKKAKQVAKSLLFSSHRLSLMPLAKSFLQKTLLEKVSGDQEELLPPSYLPQSSLNALLTLTSPQLQALLAFLGLHDLSFEIRQIIETTKLRQITQCLSPDEQAYLKQLLQQQEPLAFKKMGLERWRGDQETLRALLQQRGLNRLGKALFNEEPSLLWYVSHRLDIELGTALIKLSTDIGSPKAAAFLQEQAAALISHVQHLTLNQIP